MPGVGALPGAVVPGRQAAAQLGAAGRGACVVVVGPGQVEAEGLGLLGGGRGGEEAAEFGLALGGVALLAEHDVEPVLQGVAPAGPVVVGDEHGGVQRAEPLGLLLGGPGAVGRGDVLEQRLHHVPGRHLAPLHALAHAVGVAPPEHPGPAGALVDARQEAAEAVRELPRLLRELIHRHRRPPPDRNTQLRENTNRVTDRLRGVFEGDANAPAGRPARTLTPP